MYNRYISKGNKTKQNKEGETNKINHIVEVRELSDYQTELFYITRGNIVTNTMQKDVIRE